MQSPFTTASRGNDAHLAFSLRDLLNIVFKRKVMISVVAFSVFAVVLMISLLMPRYYRVSATLLVNEARAEIPLAPADSQQLIVSQVSEYDLNSEIEVLKSRNLIEDTLKKLGVDEAAAPEMGRIQQLIRSAKGLLAGKELPYFDQMVVQLQRDLRIEAVRRSNIIRISYRSKDAKWATDVVSTLTDQYLDRRAERYQSHQAVSFFEKQMREAETRLEQQQALLEQYVGAADVTLMRVPDGSDVMAAQKALVMQRLSYLEGELANAEVEIREQTQEVLSLQGRLEGEPDRLQSSNRLNQDAATEEIERALASLRLERDSLLQDFKPDSRYVRDVETQIRLAEARLEEARKVSGVSRTEPNPVYQELKSELVRAEANLEGAKARADLLRQQVSDNQKKLNDLNEKGFEIESLSREANAAEEDYLLYRKKHEEARISAAMDQQKLINVSVAEPAQRPLAPESRGLKIRLLAGLLAGILGGLGLALAVEVYFDHSFTTGDDLERVLGIPHLASIPDSTEMG